MRAAAACGKLPFVGERRPVQVLVEVEEAGSTVRGLITVAGGEPFGFFGWLELIDRLGLAASQAPICVERADSQVI